MKQYHDFLRYVLENGVTKEDRTGTGTVSAIVPPAMRFNLQHGFPIVTTKKVNFKAVKYELKWFTSGNTNIKYLVDNGVNIWNGDAYRWYKEKGGQLSKEEYIKEIKNNLEFSNHNGDLGPIYGRQWVAWKKYEEDDKFVGGHECINQLSRIIEQIKSNPNSRRLIVSAWNVAEIDKMALPPCHVLFQFFVVDDKLNLHLYQRSGDAFLGVPFNISSYSLLLHIVANETGLKPHWFIHTVGDAHIYLNHIEQVKEQLTREPYELPKLIFPKDATIENWNPDDFALDGYKHHPAIHGKLSV